jgi:hypothetical protein
MHACGKNTSDNREVMVMVMLWRRDHAEGRPDVQGLGFRGLSVWFCEWRGDGDAMA